MMDRCLLRLLPKQIVEAKHEMGDTYRRIARWSLKVHSVVFVMLLGSAYLLLKASYLLALAPLSSAFTLRWLFILKTKSKYEAFCEARNAEFLYFFTLLVPYLNTAKGSLYRILMKLETRMMEGHLKKGVNRLMLQMTNYPGEIGPYLEFAKTCSGSELAKDVAMALYDFQHSSDDQAALGRLKEKVSDALDKRVEEIVDLKLARFRWYSSRVVMSVFVLILGILGTSIWAEIMKAFSVMNRA